MVSREILEIRVGFRIHGKTGKPVPARFVEDGYVHMKWAIFADAHGNRIHASGSLNESRSSLVAKAENIDVHCEWANPENKKRVERGVADFERLWKNENPHFRVLTLPEAVREKLIQIAESKTDLTEIGGSVVVPRHGEDAPSALELLKFALIKDGPLLPGGKYVGMATAPVSPWPHQEVVARRLIESWPYSYLLCDEVGLGKTIEAGLAIRSLYLSGLARRVLIAEPASLTTQWQRELAFKFFLPFARSRGDSRPGHDFLLPEEASTKNDDLFEPDLNIVSTGLLVRKEHKAVLERPAPFDLALLDEAHYARRSNPTHGLRAEPRFNNLFRLVEETLKPKTNALYLATARFCPFPKCSSTSWKKRCTRSWRNTAKASRIKSPEAGKRRTPWSDST